MCKLNRRNHQCTEHTGSERVESFSMNCTQQYASCEHTHNRISGTQAQNNMNLFYEVQQFATSFTTMGTHMPYGMTECNLPPTPG